MRKKIIIGLLSAMLVFLIAGLANAALTFNDPAAGATISGGTVLLNVTSDINISYMNFTVACSDTANSTAIIVLNLDHNETETTLLGGTGPWNGTFDSYAFQDSSSCTITATSNTTDSDTASRSVIIDNSVPVCSQSTFTTSGTYDPSSTTLTITGTNATGASLTLMGNSYTPSETGTSDVFTFALSSVPEGTSNPTITTTDGKDTTTCTAVTSITLDKKEGGAPATGTDTQQDSSSDGGPSKGVIVVVFAAIALTLAILNKK